MPNSDQRVGGEIPLPGASEVSAGTNQVVDLILRARLKALAHNLGPILQPSTWEGKFPQLRVPHKLWKALDQDIGVPTEKLRKEILEIVEDPAEISWQKYHDLVARSEPIFGESLEVQRGLAVRDKLLDENICEIADHLIIDCAEVAFQSPSLTVPASHEALARTMGRILRIRYPEWTVWTLPLIALEYGHVIVREAYVREPIEEAFSAPVDPGIVACLYSLVAEAFATYTMGPSYAYAMILLRLDARRAFTNEVTHAAPDTRVNLILFMLEKMNEVAQEKYYRKPYVDPFRRSSKPGPRWLPAQTCRRASHR